jgi:N-acetylglutamate synthase-like GNAT family acetyltransferase
MGNHSPTGPNGGWPARLRVGALRWARASSHYEATVAFYRDVIGLPVVDTFSDSFTEDGTIFGLPDTGTQMEVIRARPDDRDRGSFDQLVLYLEDADALAAATAGLRERGVAPDPQPHPYWQANGAVSYQDPDGRAVVFAPWVYGRDPEPIGGHVDRQHPVAERVEIGEYTGDRAALRWLFEFAEDSATELDGYIHDGRVLVARRGTEVVGHLQLVPTDREAEIELKNMAVVPQLRGTGVGKSLVAVALAQSRADGTSRIIVATAAADVGNLRFYQRTGFRVHAVERDAFTPRTGYSGGMSVRGIPLLDRVWLSQEL